MRVRLLSRAAVAVAASAAAATLLSGCRSNVGVAATVNGHKISESTVSKYVTQEGADPSVAAQAEAQGGLPPPKGFVLQILILERLFEDTLAANGGVPSAGELAAVHDKAAQAILGTTSTGRAIEREEGTSLKGIGVSTSFAPVLVRTLELNYILGSGRLKSTSLGAAMRKAGADVTVNPRYGEWSKSQLTLDYGDKAGLPDYLKLQPTPAAGAEQPGLPGQ